MLFFKKNYLINEIGICPVCLKLKKRFKEYDENDSQEFHENTCPDCMSEAISVGHVGLNNFLKTINVDELQKELDAQKENYLASFYNLKASRINFLRNLIEELNGSSDKSSHKIRL